MNAFDLVIDFKGNVNLNDKLSSLINALTSVGFENKVTMPNLVLFIKDNIHTIIITQQQYTYKVNSEIPDELFPEIVKYISSTIDSIREWITEAAYCLRLVSTRDCTDSFQRTKEINSLSNDDSSIIGTGYRYFINGFDRLSEFKAEPYIRDKNKLFFEGIYNLNGFTTKIDLYQLLEGINSDFENRIEMFKQII